MTMIDHAHVCEELHKENVALKARLAAVEQAVALAAMELGEYAACWGSRQAIDAIINMVDRCHAAGRGEEISDG